MTASHTELNEEDEAEDPKPLFQTGPQRYQSDPNFGDIDQKKLVRVVGFVALGLPIVLWLASHNPIYSTCFRFSISHFYYAPFWGTAFTGTLFFIGTYLMVWTGEAQNRADGKLATRAGLAAYGVALFPTGGWGCDTGPFSARPMTDFDFVDGAAIPSLVPPPGTPEEVANAYFRLDFPISWLDWFQAAWLHYLSALIMFAFLAWFSLYVFTRVDPHQRNAKGGLTARKALRNLIYILTGLTIIACIFALVVGFALRAFVPSVDMSWWDAYNVTFWVEAIALISFGVSWIVKSQLLTFLRDRVKPATSESPGAVAD